MTNSVKTARALLAGPPHKVTIDGLRHMLELVVDEYDAMMGQAMVRVGTPVPEGAALIEEAAQVRALAAGVKVQIDAHTQLLKVGKGQDQAAWRGKALKVYHIALTRLGELQAAMEVDNRAALRSQIEAQRKELNLAASARRLLLAELKANVPESTFAAIATSLATLELENAHA